jgi:ribonuclease J
MPKIDFYGAVNEIGGNKILINGPETSFFFDFGMGFSRANKYLSEFLQPRKSNGIIDFVELGLLPCIKGIYREDYLRHVGFKYEEEPAVDGVLISHSHVDHVSYIHHLREDIPIYLNKQSYLILKALEDTGTTPFSEYLHLKKSFQLTPAKKGNGFTRPKEIIDRDIEIIEPYEKFQIGEFNIKSAPVDHSLPGATGYIASNDEDTIVYTGDLRFHGRQPELTEKFVQEAKKSKPTAMICEGTRIKRHEHITEFEIEKNAVDIISNSKGLVVVNFPVRDLDRLVTFYKAAQETNRQLVVSLKQAYILNLFTGQGYPEMDDVMVYQPRKGWGLIGDDRYACLDDEWICTSDIDPKQVERDYKVWEREYLEKDNTVTHKDLKEDPEDYVFRCDFFELKELIDIKPEKGVYIKSSTEPFDEQMEIDAKKVELWLNMFNLKLEKGGYHASGHANGTELLNMIREINPDRLYPVHTDHVECFDVLKDDGIKVIHPDLSQ